MGADHGRPLGFMRTAISEFPLVAPTAPEQALGLADLRHGVVSLPEARQGIAHAILPVRGDAGEGGRIGQDVDHRLHSLCVVRGQARWPVMVRSDSRLARQRLFINEVGFGYLLRAVPAYILQVPFAMALGLHLGE